MDLDRLSRHCSGYGLKQSDTDAGHCVRGEEWGRLAHQLHCYSVFYLVWCAIQTLTDVLVK